ncbi:helix-turn-helix domain-containing protein [Staphylococcus ratti]|uniref:Helix-turn-helix domain-containing protein n=1 Tax=Staphylococcus ratti TaxID=2892440 RepID=A0ABY3PCW1_9STAP|nr:helix-turn-helix transcriptional regulator [Staphylococcus ratti]UEX90157.1 helix-turn-helix domain-containing protein [Staphylococcus ratti]
MEVGKQIKYYRKAHDLSQTALADKVYVSSQTISNWENERSYPDLESLISLTELFNISLDQLVKGDVEVMKNTLDRNNMDEYGKRMVIFMLLFAVSEGAALSLSDGWFGLLLPFVFWIIGMRYAMKIEYLKKKYDVKTYKEIVDYLENNNTTPKAPRNKTKYIFETIFIVTGFIVSAVIIMLLSMWLFGWL